MLRNARIGMRPRHAAVAFAAVAVVGACLLLRSVPLANSAIIAASGAFFSRWLGRKAGGAFLGRVVLGSYLLIIVLAVALYAISALGLPLLAGLQLGGGFWTFAWDAPTYHAFAAEILDSWSGRAEFPQREHLEYSVFTASIYLVFGIHPLNAILANALFHSVVVASAFSLGQRASGTAAGRISALLVGFWPSLLLWSAQLLKDTLLLMFVFLLLDLAARGLDRQAFLNYRWLAKAAWWTGFFMLVLLTYRFRWYLVLFFAMALAVTLVVGAVINDAGYAGVRPATVLLLATLAASVLAGHIGIHQSAARAHLPGDVKEQATARRAPPPPDDRSVTRTVLPQIMDPLRSLNNVRRGSASSGGSLVDPDVQFKTVWDVILYLPRGVALALFSPFPSEWLQAARTTGVFKAFAGVESVMMWALLLPLVIGGVVAACSGRMESVLLLTWVGICASFIAIAIANLGTLFRLRLEFLMPGMVLVGGGLEWLRSRLLATGKGEPITDSTVR